MSEHIPHTEKVLLADPAQERRERLAQILRTNGFAVAECTSAQEALDAFYADPPQCVVVPLGMAGSNSDSLLLELKGDNVYGHIPVVVMLTPEELNAGVDWTHTPADDYLLEINSDDEIRARMRLCLARALRDVHANPLTGLPGNLTITRETDKRLAAGDKFAFAYLDIDHFKAYNDKYGFARGDEVLRMTARIVVNAIRAVNNPSTYVGHIGGDDFVFILPSDAVHAVCKRTISHFDLIVRDFYDEEDRKHGCIQSKDRQGNAQQFPLMGISIGAVDTSVSKVANTAEMFARVTEIKSFAKRLPGSNYIVDRRG